LGLFDSKKAWPTWAKILLGAYLAGALFTLVFQTHVRSQECVDAEQCAVSFAKGAVWSAFWPVIWPIYI
jgi:hypothetical protein